jgi:hypothetical protein
MRRIRYLVGGLVLFTLAFNSCKNDKKATSEFSNNSTVKEANVLTDSLVYGIVTQVSENIDPYENESFKTFLQNTLINSIFEQLYDGKFKAYDILSDKLLTIKELKEIEATEGFSRSKVGKAQFNEQWYYDNNGKLNKRVNSISFGLESYSNQGTFYGYKALFKVKF